MKSKKNSKIKNLIIKESSFNDGDLLAVEESYPTINIIEWMLAVYDKFKEEYIKEKTAEYYAQI